MARETLGVEAENLEIDVEKVDPSDLFPWM
jgi:hypothetical protein